MTLLNLGCGQRFHNSWTNIDFVSTVEGVLVHNLLKGIPFSDSQIDVVYHSHLLEHFSKADGINFIKECYRVLKPGGIIRIAVPNMEEIVINYLKSLKGALKGNSASAYNYEWMMLELYDQTVRNTSGGEMAKYLYRKEIPNKEYVFNRIGDEGKSIQENYLNSLIKKTDKQKRSILFSIKYKVKRLYQFPKFILTRALFRKEYEVIKNQLEAIEIGRFRLSGEVHQWMYDRYSLGLLLKGSGFTDIKVVTSIESRVSEWNKYELDVKNGAVLKPDSLFMEAAKPL